ncbi:MAG: hypothetical protein C4296_03785 [Gemmataceae bacterium]
MSTKDCTSNRIAVRAVVRLRNRLSASSQKHGSAVQIKNITWLTSPAFRLAHSNACQWASLVCVLAAQTFFALGSCRTITGHEAYVVQGSSEMVATGDWAVPRIAGQPWLEKPPLPHWILAVLSVLVGHLDSVIARVPSALVGCLGVLVFSGWVSCRWGTPIGVLTGLQLCTSLYFVTYARLAEADIYLWAVVIIALTAYGSRAIPPRHRTGSSPAFCVEADVNNSKGSWQCATRLSGPIFYLCLGLVNLIKGPFFGWAVILVVVFAHVAVYRSTSGLKLLMNVPGWLFAFIVGCTWYLFILWVYPETWQLWGLHTFGRLNSQMSLNPERWWYYLEKLPLQLMPWTGLILLGLPIALRQAWGQRDQHAGLLFLWALAPILMLSCVSAKHHHYIIHALPPLSWAGALGMKQFWYWFVRYFSTSGRWIFGASCIFSVSSAAFCVVVVCNNIVPIAFLPAILLGIVTIYVLTWVVRRREPALAAAVAFGSYTIISCYIYGWIQPEFDRYRDETVFLVRVATRIGGVQDSCLIFGIDPARVLIYGPQGAAILPEELLRGGDKTTVWEFVNRMKSAGGEHQQCIGERVVYVITSLAHEPVLRRLGEPVLLDAVKAPRWEKMGPQGQLALYAWRVHGP